MDEILELTIQNELGEISRVSEQFALFAGQHQLPGQIVVAIQIVFEELLSNIILYGGGRDITMKVEIDAEQVSATIVDDGIAFNPFDAPEPDTTQALEDREVGGLGVHIVLTMMDEVSYERVGNKNVVTVSKFWDRAEG
jgi:anti-sigma regulatory factor (Ser/Thr protein kinase)